MRKLICLSVLLSGCATHDPAMEAAQEQARREAYTKQVITQCHSYGFKIGTPEFKQCVFQVDMANRQQDEARRQIILQQFLQQQGDTRPFCYTLPPGLQGYERAGGRCR